MLKLNSRLRAGCRDRRAVHRRCSRVFSPRRTSSPRLRTHKMRGLLISHILAPKMLCAMLNTLLGNRGTALSLASGCVFEEKDHFAQRDSLVPRLASRLNPFTISRMRVVRCAAESESGSRRRAVNYNDNDRICTSGHTIYHWVLTAAKKFPPPNPVFGHGVTRTQGRFCFRS